MSNGARHGLGALIGLVVTPIIAACLMYGTTRLGFFIRTFYGNGGEDRWIGGGVILVAAVLIGLVAGSRVSPLASLIPGAAYGVIGLLWILAPRWTIQHSGRDTLPRELEYGYITLGPFGIFLMLGVALVVASVAPSRWQARAGARTAPRYGAPPPAPMGPPPMHGVPPVIGGPHPPQAPQAPGQSSPPWQGTPQYGQAPAASNPPPLPAAPPASPASESPTPSSSRSGSDDDDEPGDWTRMYGGNR
ncbi:hypothetical protein E1264_06045 [Actinomadura sp. KC216]|uniref:hypothetical protein n=1 Tax=Actinomadura sp. KC216 TaxID=2530370 RepID=UPI001043B2F3|nr:hypothetical protein [Actinomadura sp. KC216]TDB90089.1 hypothetical protein E1264_06045 [Actinomadura sp. KC216]